MTGTEVTQAAMNALRMAAVSLVLAAGACVPMPKPTLSSADLDDATRVTAYLNALPRFEARFVQSGSFGAGAGLIWLDRPGHLRIDYAGAASRVMVIADGKVRVLDRSNGALTTMAVSRTPLGLLLAPTISLSGAAHLESLVHQGDQLRVVVTKTDAPAQGRLTLDFADRPLRLQAVSVTDAYARILTMQFSDIDRAPALTPSLFAPPVVTPAS